MSSAREHGVNEWRSRIVGLDHPTPLLDGRVVPYVNLDNAASTPPLRGVMDEVERFLPYYSSVHRGTGFKSRLSTAAYEDARETIARFVNADTRTHTVIFGKNTTEAINKLAHRYPLPPRGLVVSTEMEHHSNDLPWRGRADIIRVKVDRDGRLDEADLDRVLGASQGRVALVTVSGASNVTGYVQPIHRIARKAHAVGARILVDAAQLAPHRPIDVGPDDDPEHLDYVALSAHKMYAPFGTGALIGWRDTFEGGIPEYRGGGTVDLVTESDVEWAGVPDREEAGSPNVVGAFAMAAAARALTRESLQQIARHESELTAYALARLGRIRGVTLYGDSDPAAIADRLGVIPFNVATAPHALAAAVLGYEGGIGVRSGCFCAQIYVARLLGLSSADLALQHQRLRAGDRSDRPGMVRVSLGAYNTIEEIDLLIETIDRVARGDYAGRYAVDRETGEYHPVGAGRNGIVLDRSRWLAHATVPPPRRVAGAPDLPGTTNPWRPLRRTTSPRYLNHDTQGVPS